MTVPHSVHFLHVRLPVFPVRIFIIATFGTVREAAVRPVVASVCPEKSTSGKASWGISQLHTDVASNFVSLTVNFVI